MAIYDLGTASLAANGEVTGAGTVWKAPLTLIRVGATIIFKTNPLKIYTISEIISDTQINVYNPNSETVPAGTGYAILAHDGITVQGLAQDVAETLRYYQSKETSIEGLLQFIGQDTFDWPRFEKLAKQSTTGAAEALASQIAAAESAATAVGASNNAQNSYKRTVAVINAAGNTAAVAYFAEHGIGSTTTPLLTSLDWQTMQFYSGGSYQCRIDNMVNIPADLSSMFPATNTTICIDVLATSGINGSNVVRISPSTTSNAAFRVAEITFTGATGSRNFYVRELLSVPGGDGATGGASALRVRGLLDVYSKNETFQKSLNFSDVKDKAAARTNLDVYSKEESTSRFIGDLVSYGADNTGATPVDSSFDAMISDGRFVVKSGVYLISSTKTIDIGRLKEVSISEDVVFLIKTDIDGFVFKNPIANFNANGMRIEVDIPGGGYSRVALTLRGSNYYTGPQNFSRLSQRTFFGNFYVFNKQGAIKQEAAASPVNDEGYGFSIDCNSKDQEVLIWNDIDVSSTGFTNAHAISVGSNKLNFISSMDLNLVAWLSTNHFVDNSLPKSGGNVAGGIGDIRVRLKSQPHAMMQKVVKISNGIGFMDGCFFDLTIWDPNLIKYRAGIVDATTGNHYTNTLERLSYPLTRALNVVNASLFPVKNFSSTIQDSNVIVNSSSEIAKYLYFSNVKPSMTVLEAFNAVNAWCVSNNVKSDFEFRLSLSEATGDIRSVFQPWLNEIQDDTGFISIFGHYYSGAMSTIRCIYQVNSITSGGKIEEHEILWNRNSDLVSHRLKEYSYGTTAEIKAKRAFQPVGFTTFDTNLGIPVWYNGTSWLKADGSVAYGA
ncbi:tail fibers protein [Escherichia phage BEK6]|nr:tail fibers protein [Escherichia phage BEK6]